MAKSAARNTPRGSDADTRASRTQESRDAEPVHEVPISFESTGPLPNIPARPGYSQRWVRVKKGADNDAHNIFSAQRKGFTPRKPDTVAQHLQWLTVQHEGMGGCVGTHDVVLMERPNELSAQEAEIKRRDRRARTAAVKNNLFSEFKNVSRAAGDDTMPEIENVARVERGRPQIQDD